MNIILLAPPAAGKGTQAEMLKDIYHITHISTGDLLREAGEKNDDLGRTIKETIARGEFISDDLMYEVLINRMSSPDCQNGFILDGFPRNIEQAREYENILKKLGLKLEYVFLLNVDKDILEKRITGRRLCRQCGAIYNINMEESMPTVEGRCDKCFGRLYQRDDDNLNAFETRYETYLKKTKPLIDYYKEKNVLYEIDGSIDKETTLAQIKLLLDREMN